MSRRRQSLDGNWEIQLEPGAAFVPIRVPFTFEAALSGIDAADEIHERVVYRRSFDWEGGHAMLHFGAVDWRASVSLDGVPLGTHTGGNTRFAFELGELGRGRHELVVEVEDAQVSTNEPVDVHIEPDGVDRPRLWSPDDPCLYDVTVRAGEDEVMSYVAFRSIGTSGRDVLLNGEPIVLHGVLDQGYWPDGGAHRADGRRATRGRRGCEGATVSACSSRRTCRAATISRLRTHAPASCTSGWR